MHGSGLRFQSLEFEVEGERFKIKSIVFRVLAVGLRNQNFGFKVSGFGI